jgi:hypothetical protein
MIHFTLIVIIVNVPGAAAPVVQEPIIQVPEPPEVPLDPMRWHCPQCGWWNTYDNQKAFKIGSFQHLKRCKGQKKKMFG